MVLFILFSVSVFVKVVVVVIVDVVVAVVDVVVIVVDVVSLSVVRGDSPFLLLLFRYNSLDYI